MCDTNVYIYDKNKNEMLFLENVDVIRPEEGKIYMKNLFGEQKVYDGEIEEISLIKHKILLRKKNLE